MDRNHHALTLRHAHLLLRAFAGRLTPEEREEWENLRERLGLPQDG